MNNKKVFKVILCAMLVLALVISNFAGLDLGFVKIYAQEPVTMQGSGSKEDPYQITNYAQLKEFAGIVNDGQTYACAKLMNDIVCTDKLWVPIGFYNDDSDKALYSGQFDGNNMKIIGLNYTGFNDVDDREYQGLFGYIGSNGTVKNIGIEGGEIKGKYYIGGVTGYNGGTITNCYNTGSISGSENYYRVGGVAAINNGTITNCYNTGSISGSGGYAVGGGVAGINSGTITNCYNTGSISGSGDYADVGGVAGYNSKTITNCYYDSNRSNVSKAASNQEDNDTVEGLTTDEMTGSNALEKMVFVKSIEINSETINLDNWITKANDVENGYSFYPHLKGFNFDSDDKQLDAADIEPGNWPGRVFELSGAGTEASPYEIENYDELKEFADVVNGTGKYKKNKNILGMPYIY